YVVQNIDFFNNVPNLIFAYQLNGKLKKIYLENKFLLDYIDTRAGVVTGDDELFIRFWYEINTRDIELTPKIENKYKYVPFSKGGTFTKWYGNVHNVLRYDYFLDDNKTNKSIRRGDSNCYFKRCIGWSQMAGGAHKN